MILFSDKGADEGPKNKAKNKDSGGRQQQGEIPANRRGSYVSAFVLSYSPARQGNTENEKYKENGEEMPQPSRETLRRDYFRIIQMALAEPRHQNTDVSVDWMMKSRKFRETNMTGW